jgi:tRNA (adenine37-N6)-methyltransferase
MKLPLFPRRKASATRFAEPINLLPIAHVKNRVTRPRIDGWDQVESDLQLVTGLQPEMLSGLDGFSHVIVVFFLDRLPEDRPRPAAILVGTDPVQRGILATRSQLRPNPLGVSIVPLTGVGFGSIRVRGLDALDGTPVIDIKPYIPHYDSVPNATVPGWVYTTVSVED